MLWLLSMVAGIGLLLLDFSNNQLSNFFVYQGIQGSKTEFHVFHGLILPHFVIPTIITMIPTDFAEKHVCCMLLGNKLDNNDLSERILCKTSY